MVGLEEMTESPHSLRSTLKCVIWEPLTWWPPIPDSWLKTVREKRKTRIRIYPFKPMSYTRKFLERRNGTYGLNMGMTILKEICVMEISCKASPSHVFSDCPKFH